MEISCSDAVRAKTTVAISFRVKFKGKFEVGVVYGLLLEIYYFSKNNKNINHRIPFLVGNKVSENEQMVIPLFCLKPNENIPDVNFGLQNGFHPICFSDCGSGEYMIQLNLVSIHQGHRQEIKILKDCLIRLSGGINYSNRQILSGSEIFAQYLREEIPTKDNEPKKDKEPKKDEKSKEVQEERKEIQEETFLTDELTKDITEEEFSIKTFQNEDGKNPKGFQEQGIRQRKNK